MFLACLQGATALMYASSQDRPEMVQTLLMHNANLTLANDEVRWKEHRTHAMFTPCISTCIQRQGFTLLHLSKALSVAVQILIWLCA